MQDSIGLNVLDISDIESWNNSSIVDLTTKVIASWKTTFTI